MKKSKEKIIFAVPKGRILEEIRPLLKQINIKPEESFFDESARALRFTSNIDWLDFIRIRSFDVATFVAFGAAHIGIAGNDVLEEFDYPDIYVPVDLNLGVCRMSLAAPKDMKKNGGYKNESHLSIATKYPNTTKRYFAKKGIQAECIKLNGAIELAPKLGLSQYIVDLVSTGKTLAENGLSEVEKIADVSSRLIVNRTAFKIKSAKLGPLIADVEKTLKKMKKRKKNA